MLSVIIPVYNGAAVIDSLTRRLSSVLEDFDDEYEIIFIDDGSCDETIETLRRICIDEPFVSFLRFERNCGQQMAVLCGLRVCRGDWVVTMDDDLQHPPELIPNLVDEAVRGGFDAVYAVPRQTGVSGGRMRDVLFAFMLGKPPGLRIGSFRVFSRAAVKHISGADGAFVYISAELFSGGFQAASICYRSEKDEHGVHYSRYGLFRRVKLYLRLFIWYAPISRLVVRAFFRNVQQYRIAERGGVVC